MAELAAEDLVVIIPTRSRWSTLGRTLDGLAHQTVRGFETLVVVDGEDEQVPPLDGVRVLVRPHGGPGAARNAGVAAADQRLVLFLGDDMVPTPTLVERHLARHNQEPEPNVAVLGQAQWHPDVATDRIARWLDWSDTQFDYRLITTDDAGFGRFFSCNVSLKRDFFLEAGGFDEDFVYYYEDLDCGWRLHEHGLRLRYEPGALTHHLHRYDWTGIERRFQGVARGERLMQAKRPEFEPWFAGRMRQASASRPASLGWPAVVERIPPSLGRLRRHAERRANDAYYQRLAPGFFNAWHADRGLEELRAYLGSQFDEARLNEHRHLVDLEEAEAVDEAAFYRTSEAYLYDLTAFAMWGTKAPYLGALRRFLPPGGSVLDYGCGIGADGLQLLEDGYQVSFADFDNPSTRYLRWRLERRGLDAPVFDIDQDVPAGFDAAFSFDVIEHVPDPWEFLAGLERRAGIVAVNLLEDDPADTHLHKPLPIGALLDHAAAKGMLWYRKYHGRSHLAIYRTHGRVGRLRSTSQRRLGGRVPSLTPAVLDRLGRRRDAPST